jgi:hypothetical protein
MPELYGCEESLRALRFRCDLGVKKFSQRAQRLRNGRNVFSFKRKKPKPVISSINGKAMVSVSFYRLVRC